MQTTKLNVEFATERQAELNRMWGAMLGPGSYLDETSVDQMLNTLTNQSRTMYEVELPQESREDNSSQTSSSNSNQSVATLARFFMRGMRAAKDPLVGDVNIAYRKRIMMGKHSSVMAAFVSVFNHKPRNIIKEFKKREAKDVGEQMTRRTEMTAFEGECVAFLAETLSGFVEPTPVVMLDARRKMYRYLAITRPHMRKYDAPKAVEIVVNLYFTPTREHAERARIMNLEIMKLFRTTQKGDFTEISDRHKKLYGSYAREVAHRMGFLRGKIRRNELGAIDDYMDTDPGTGATEGALGVPGSDLLGYKPPSDEPGNKRSPAKDGDDEAKSKSDKTGKADNESKTESKVTNKQLEVPKKQSLGAASEAPDIAVA
jgi:hypothetical protein